MGDLECHFIESCEFKPWIWWHFLDDIFMIWLHGREKLESFLDDLNTFHETIKFTWEISYTKIYFLDVMFTLENGCFTTDIYSKPTDTHRYLNYKSCHPPHVKRAIPYSQALRLRRICYSDELFNKGGKELKGFLVQRGYSERFVEQQILKEKMKNRKVLMLGAKKSSEKCARIPIVLDYHPALLDLHKVFRELQPIVDASKLLKEILPETPIVSFRRPKSIKDMLVRAVDEQVKAMFQCGKARCKIGQFIEPGSTFCSFVEKRTFCINHHFDCDSQGVIHLISWKKCGKQYVGSTITSFRYRCNNHKSSLTRFGRGQRGICGEHLYSHFFSKGHSGVTGISPSLDSRKTVTPHPICSILELFRYVNNVT